jgi:hypothetical protein
MAQSEIFSGDDFSVGFSDRKVTAWGLPEPGSNRGYIPYDSAQHKLLS